MILLFSLRDPQKHTHTHTRLSQLFSCTLKAPIKADAGISTSSNLCVLVSISLCGGANAAARALLQIILLVQVALVSLNPSNACERERQATHTTRTRPGHGHVLTCTHRLTPASLHTLTSPLLNTHPLERKQHLFQVSKCS